MSELLEIEHKRVGAISVDPDSVIHFDYIPGFPGVNRFALLAGGEASAFAWLVCLDDCDLAFHVTDPLSLFPDYDPLADPEQLALFPDSAREHLVVLAIANLYDGRPVVNLAAPLVVDVESRIGRQLVFDDERFALRQPLELAKAPAQACEVSQIESKPQR